MIVSIEKYQNRLLKKFNITYKRYLFEKIDLNENFIAIYGARGVGKTTLLLQYLQYFQSQNKKSIYISLDYPFLSSVDLVELFEKLTDEGYEYVLLDEVHRFRDFSVYLKTIYDIFDIKVIFTSSSATSILNAKSDLSRRVSLYHLNGFSFREFLEVKSGIKLTKFKLDDILKTHQEISTTISKKIDILREFKEYLEFGYYPFYTQKESSYYQNLVNTINLTIDIDLTSLGLIEQKYTYKLKKLLEVVCESKPFEVNYTKIATLAGISRVKLYEYIRFLDEGELLLLLQEGIKGVKKIAKPAKIYLNNTNLLFAYCQNSEISTIRETFFANQLKEVHKIEVAKKGDFLVDRKYTFEIGGKSKDFIQIKDIPNSFVVADDLEVGFGNKIPLWLFGFLY